MPRNSDQNWLFKIRRTEAAISSGIEKGTVARLLSLAWSAILIALMATGTLSSARIGAITWGPQHDVWSAAIAISQINFGLPGELAYKEVEQAIANEVTSTKNMWSVWDDATRGLDNDPAAVTRGFQAAAAIKKQSLAIPASKDGYVSDWAEDLGYADFYDLAFRLFGFSADSTHYLYFSLLAAALVLFALAFVGDSLAVGSLTLSVTALFLLSCSSFFSESTPSFAANRFLSTLALIPLLHIVNTALRRAPLVWPELILLAAQTLIMSFAIAARGSAVWCIVAVAACAFTILVIRKWRTAKQEPPGGRTTGLMARFASPYARRVVTTAATVAALFVAFAVIRNARIDDRYFQDDNYPHHLVWHSAYLGLSQNPEWETKRPAYADVPDGGDGAGFALFEHVMRERGLPFASTHKEVYHDAYYRARVYEAFIRDEYLRFLVHNPSYAAKLFLYYKPAALFEIIAQQAGGIPRGSWFLAAYSLALASFCFAFGGSAIRLGELVICSAIVWLSSLIPVFWAYPAPHVDADEFWSASFMALMLVASLGNRLVPAVFRRTRSALMRRPGWGHLQSNRAKESLISRG